MTSTYVFNSPKRFFDPSGLDMQSYGTIEEDNYILSNLQAISSELIDMHPINGETIMNYTPIEFYIAWEDPNPI